MLKVHVPKIKLSDQQIEEICNEIEHQWLYLLMTRAVFNNAYFPTHNSYSSPSFYTNRKIEFKVSLPEDKSEAFQKGATGLKNWLNQNYVIRLYGVLEKYQILYSGHKAYKNSLMILLFELRPKIGAHSSGRKPSDRKHLRKATRMINDLFKKDRELNIDEVEHYALPLDSVLEPMKNQAIQFVRSLRA